MPGGRPLDYTPELADHICSRLAEGESMRSICRDEDMPCKTTMFRWLRTIEEFQHQYTQAKEESADTHADDINYIADNVGSPLLDDDGKAQYDKDGNVIMTVDMVAVNHAKLRIDTRKWTASKLRPKKYGDKVQNEHTGPDGGPVQLQEVRFIPVNDK